MMLDDVSRFSRRDRRPDDCYEKVRENKLPETTRNDTRLSFVIQLSGPISPTSVRLTDG